MPGSRQDLLDVGAVPVDTGKLPWLAEDGWLPVEQRGFEVLSLTRPLFEHVIRRRVAGLPGVEMRTGSKVIGLRRRDQHWEVGLSDGSTVLTDLVVDASGRGSRLPAWLAKAGVRQAPVSQVDSGGGLRHPDVRRRPIRLRCNGCCHPADADDVGRWNRAAG